MQKSIMILIVLALVTALSGACFISYAGTAVAIKYGVVTGTQIVKKDAQHAGGALAGGLAGAVFAGPRHRTAKIVASAAAGAAIQGAVTSGEVMQYTIKLSDGQEIRVTTEQQNIRLNDCVAVE